jgi:AcrR family transcriptional regulator
MNGFAKRTQEKKNSIIIAARELFFAQGVTDTKMADIAKQAGVSQVTIYNYFGSKENLLRKVMGQVMSQAFAQSQAILQEDIPFTEKLAKVMDMKQVFNEDTSQKFLDSVAWKDPALQELYQEMTSKYALPLLKSLLEQGKEQEAIHHSITWEAFVDYTTAIRGILTRPDWLKASQEHKLAIHRLFFYGLLGE